MKWKCALFCSLRSYFPNHINHEKLSFSAISVHINRNIASYHFCFKKSIIGQKESSIPDWRLFLTLLLSVLSLKDWLPRASSTKVMSWTWGEDGDTYQSGNAPVQDTLKNHSNPEFPGVEVGGQLRQTLWSSKTPDFSLCLILLRFPPFHGGWSQGCFLINILTPFQGLVPK